MLRAPLLSTFQFVLDRFLQPSQVYWDRLFRNLMFHRRWHLGGILSMLSTTLEGQCFCLGCSCCSMMRNCRRGKASKHPVTGHHPPHWLDQETGYVVGAVRMSCLIRSRSNCLVPFCVLFVRLENSVILFESVMWMSPVVK